MSNQGDRQASVRTASGTATALEGDWLALFDATAGVKSSGAFNERLLSYINTKLSASYTNINEAKQAFADSEGVTNWASLGTFSA